MNYFELFDIPIQLTIDKSLIKKRFFELSRKTHPDYFINAGPKEQEEALEASAMLNKALRVLSDPDATIAYVLQLKGLLEENEKYSLDPEFLMEMMDLNEAFADAPASDNSEEKTSLTGQLEGVEREIYEPVADVILNYRDGVTSDADLLKVKDYYFKKKYLNRLRLQLK